MKEQNNTNADRFDVIVESTRSIEGTERQLVIKLWRSFHGSDYCMFCQCHFDFHNISYDSWHFYRSPSFVEMTLYERGHDIDLYYDQEGKIIFRHEVPNTIDLLDILCGRCARHKGTKQVVCYSRAEGIGEYVGLIRNGAIWTKPPEQPSYD